MEQIISLETAKLAKEKGFDWDNVCFCDREYMEGFDEAHSCTAHPYHEGVEEKEVWKAPTQSLLQKWLREEKEIDIVIKQYIGKE